MNIYILGPVGSGKSTVSTLLASKLGWKYIPEFEDEDLTFHRLLDKRNTLNTTEAKVDFQYYTLEQAYRRQVNQDNVIIDTPILQHRMMASLSLDEDSYINYIEYYKEIFKRVEPRSQDLIFVLRLDFETCLQRIKLRGRTEEKLSEIELKFYKDFYDKLYSEMFNKATFINAQENPETIVNNIITEIHKYY